jgi:hypothetical protein
MNMSDNTAVVLLMFIFFGWIPILALGKAISWCVKANICKKEREDK